MKQTEINYWESNISSCLLNFAASQTLSYLALLEIRNQAEAARKEKKLKDALEAEGKSSDHVKVEPGSVDWLWGDKGPKGEEDMTGDKVRG